MSHLVQINFWKSEKETFSFSFSSSSFVSLTCPELVTVILMPIRISIHNTKEKETIANACSIIITSFSIFKYFGGLLQTNKIISKKVSQYYKRRRLEPCITTI
jgi:hypothetical protein